MNYEDIWGKNKNRIKTTRFDAEMACGGIKSFAIDALRVVKR